MPSARQESSEKLTYISDLAMQKVDLDALACVPESVARENLVLATIKDSGGIRFIVPQDCDLGELETKLTFIFAMPVELDTADRDCLKATIDFYYTAMFAEIENCPPRFSVECPKRWLELKETDEKSVRFCEVCKSRVYRCETRADVNINAGMGRCVAYEEPGAVDTLGLIEFPC